MCGSALSRREAVVLHRASLGCRQARVDIVSLSAFYLCSETLDEAIDFLVDLHEFHYLLYGVQDSGVISIADSLADFGEAGISELSCEIHDVMACIDDGAGPLVSDDLVGGDARDFRHCGDDEVYRDLRRGCLGDVLEDLTREFHRDRPFAE